MTSVADILLCFGDFKQHEDADQPQALSSNESFILDPSQLSSAQQRVLKGDHVDPLPDPTFALCFEQNIYSPEGWVFGSSDDTAVSDFQIVADHSSGVSRRHIRIDVDPDYLRPRVTNLSHNAIRITSHAKGDDARHITLEKEESELLPTSARLDFGPVSFSFWRPKLVARENLNEFRKHVNNFNKAVLDALPRNADTGNLTPYARRAVNGDVYVQEKLIAHGASGSVYKVRKVNTKEIYAAKIAHYREADGASKALGRYKSAEKEFDKMKKLAHPNIVKVIALIPGIGMEPTWLVEEYIPKTLAEVVLSIEEEAPGALQDIASGLEYIHSQRITHRDLTSTNILVEMESGHSDGKFLRAKLGDFGISTTKIADMSTFTGTFSYMAPELWAAAGTYSMSVDVFALGVIMVEQLTSGESGKVLRSIGKRLPTKEEFQLDFDDLRAQIEQAPAHFKELLKGATEKTPDQRWTASKCREWLARYISGPKKRPASQQLGPPGRQPDAPGPRELRDSSFCSIADTEPPPTPPSCADSPDSVADSAIEHEAEEEKEEEDSDQETVLGDETAGAVAEDVGQPRKRGQGSSLSLRQAPVGATRVTRSRKQ
ncbi:kinase-like domain-containing protein [Microdochium bolleyi]|uniref:EKC/KEOPS complex subunit BUD32 n=1 Tax=Microdochium bolleyi TaxID=196109 RepID=A0A136II28_9PEZI|nr:kinase-like domain-containing protein [Microdochium bolleyi]